MGRVGGQNWLMSGLYPSLGERQLTKRRGYIGRACVVNLCSWPARLRPLRFVTIPVTIDHPIPVLIGALHQHVQSTTASTSARPTINHDRTVMPPAQPGAAC